MVIQPQVYQAAVDDSGSEPQSPIYVLGGFIATQDQWAKFAEEWQEALDLLPKLEYFKMTEAANLAGQFSQHKGWNEAKRDDRLTTLARIIKKRVRIRISASILHTDFDQQIKSIPSAVRRLATDNPYTLLVQQIVLAAAVFGDRFGINEPCDFVFDEQSGFSDEVLAYWPTFKWVLRNSSRSDLPRFVGSPPVYRDEKTFLPLQAADLYAWQVRNSYVDNHRVPNQTIVLPPTAAMRALEPIPVINREYSTAEVIRLREYLLKIGEQYAREFPDLPLIPPIADKRQRRKAHRAARKAASNRLPS